MQVEAIYDHGKLKFISPVRLKAERLKVLVTVPDDEIEIDTAYNIPHLPELTEKQRERIEAFSLRDEIKGLRSS